MNENSTEMSEDHDDGADLEWVPPTEAEQKVINARRERSDKISKLMGDYMLKGYKMLATTCGVQKHGGTCGTIELEDKRGKIYCVACQEVDCEENSKDNPAVNPIAARNQLAEGQLEDIESQIIPNQNQVGTYVYINEYFFFLSFLTFDCIKGYTHVTIYFQFDCNAKYSIK